MKNRLSGIGKSQKEIAKLLGVTAQSINAVFSAADVRSSTIERLCKVLNLPITFFYEDEECNSLNISSKDREIDFLKGQISAYEKALGIKNNPDTPTTEKSAG